MPRCSSRYWKVVPVFLLILLALTPAASAQGGLLPSPVTEVCGRVVNEVGWGLEGVEVSAIGTGFVSLAHLPTPITSTAEDGSFSLKVVHDTYTLVFVDREGPEQRAGALYQPRIENVDASAFDQLTSGGCGGPEERYAVELDEVTLPAEGSEFFVAHVVDEVVEGPLEDAQVTVEVPDLDLNLEWGDAATDDEGLSRLSCPSGLPFRLRVEKDDYQPALSQEHTCMSGIGTLALGAWRAAVSVEGTAIDDDTEDPLADAEVTASPQDLDLLDGPGYVLSTVSADNGSWALAVPWGGQYKVEATRPGYDADNQTIAVEVTPPAPLDLRLARKQIIFSGQVVDVLGQGVRATLELDGPQASGQDTDDNGNFSLELPFGDYDLTITAQGKNLRECDVQLPVDDDAPVVEPAHCLVLIQDGKSAVEGIVVDGPTQGPVEGAKVTIGLDEVLTGADGSFILEADWQADDYVLEEEAYETKTDSVSIPEQDTFVDLGEISLDRLTVPVSFHTASGDGSIEGVQIEASGVAGSGTCVSDASGDCTIGLPWTTRGDGYTDENGYDVTGRRLTAAPLYDLQVCGEDEHVDFDAPSITCALEAVPPLSTFIGNVTDAHDDQTVEDVDVVAEPVGLEGESAAAACAAPYVCTATTGGDGTALLQLPQGRTFNITFTSDRYQTAMVTGVPAGEGPDTTRLNRLLSSVEVEVSDAHTGGPIEGASLQATGDAFTCDPSSPGPCEAVTDTEGKATLELPWGDHHLNVTAGVYTVHGQVTEQGVGFQEAARDLTADTNGGPTAESGDKNQVFQLLRAPGPAINGTVTDFQGEIVPAVQMSVHDVRGDAFVCNPDPEGTGGPFPDCEGLTPLGPYNLTLPHGTHEHHQWDLGVVHDGYHREDRLVAPGTTQDFQLWPLAFDLTVEVRDQQTGELLNFVNVCIKNLDQTTASDLPAFDCPGQTGAEPVPVLFEDVGWTREDTEDTTDTFLVRAARSQYPEQVRVVEIGPAEDTLVVRLQRVPPHPPDPEAPELGRIHGAVQDADALLVDGITGARITAQRIEGPCGDGLDTYESGSIAGSYEILVGCPGDYLVQVHDPLGRYGDATAEVDVPAGESLLNPISGPGEAQQDFLLERTSSALEVQVLDATTAQGVAGATVTISGRDVDHTAGPLLTTEDGTVRFEGIPWGVYEVTADADEPEWIVGTGTSEGVAPPGGEGASVVVLVGMEATIGCQPEESPQVCSSHSSDPDVEMLSIETTGAETGAWSVFQPQIGQIATASDSASVTPLAGPHDGTWIVVFRPDPIPLQQAASEVVVQARFSGPDGEGSLEASTLGFAIGSQFHYGPLVWHVNLHTQSVVACAPELNSCSGADPTNAADLRFFLPV